MKYETPVVYTGHNFLALEEVEMLAEKRPAGKKEEPRQEFIVPRVFPRGATR